MQQKNMIKVTLGFLLLATVFGGHAGDVFAGDVGPVVINEVAWPGSADASSDEWIELYNTTAQPVDLSGWTISDDDKSAVYGLTGMIPANGYYLIEDAQSAVNPNGANLLVNLSLANSGDSLVLLDADGKMVDAVNTSGGAWFAGSSTLQATMERRDAFASGDEAANWSNSTGGSGAVASRGSVIVGTPGVLNSVSSVPELPQKLLLKLSSAMPKVGDTLTVIVKAVELEQLFAYGLEFVYDSAVLNYIDTLQGAFLGQSDAVTTSFQAGLENSNPGKLLIAEARTQAVKSGVDGSGELLTMQFKVIGVGGKASSITFGASSFLADPEHDLKVQLQKAQFTPVVPQEVDPVKNGKTVVGSKRYSLELKWDEPVNGVMSYKVYRRDSHLEWVLLGATEEPSFVDEDTVTDGGNIVPYVEYSYRIVAVKDGVDSAGVEVVAKETRGLKGDYDRSDRVDGRDLEDLARHFAQMDGDEDFESLIDTTYDGQIDGNDLIDLGVNFAKVYRP